MVTARNISIRWGRAFICLFLTVGTREVYRENMPSVLGLDDCTHVTVRTVFYQEKFRIVKWQISWERWCSMFMEFEVQAGNPGDDADQVTQSMKSKVC